MPDKVYPFGNMTTLDALKSMADYNWKQKIVDQCRDMLNSSIKFLTGEEVSVTSLALGKASSKLFYSSKTYNTRQELMKTIKPGDIALYKYGKDSWHASLYLGRDRNGKQFWYESAGYIGKNPEEANRWYKKAVVNGVPFAVGEKDRERIETGRISVERDEDKGYFHMNVANAIVSKFGSPDEGDKNTTYYKLPLKYELFTSMTQEELWDYQDYLKGLSKGYKSGVSDFYYDDTHFHSKSDSDMIIERNMKEYDRKIAERNWYDTKLKLTNNIESSITKGIQDTKKNISINIEHKKQQQRWWGGSW